MYEKVKYIFGINQKYARPVKEKDIERMYNSATTASFILGNLVKNRSLEKEGLIHNTIII